MFVFFGDLLDCLIFDLISEAILLELTFLLKTLSLEVEAAYLLIGQDTRSVSYFAFIDKHHILRDFNIYFGVLRIEGVTSRIY